MTTKQQERDALNKIRKIVTDLGTDSYIGTAMKGVLETAETNIEWDAAFSLADELEGYKQKESAATEAMKKVEELEKKITRLETELAKEQEWKPYESDDNVKQADYERLVSCVPNGAHYMTDEEAKDWICNEFGFDRRKITIHHEIDEEEINRHRQCRRTGRKIDRRPIYCATDYHYIRFDVSNWYYEIWNDRLQPFYC